MREVLIASDGPWLLDDLEAALAGPDTSIRRITNGADVLASVQESVPDLAVLDFQIGNQGGMACCLDLRLEEGAGRLPRVPVLMLLDRAADVFLAQRSDADGWLIKPIDPIRLQRAVDAVLEGTGVFEGAS